MSELIDYSVEPVSGIRELIERAFARYRKSAVFIYGEFIKTYEQMYFDIGKMCNAFHKYRRRYIALACENKYYFCVAYIAGVLTNNIMLLLPNTSDCYMGICKLMDIACIVSDSLVSSSLINNMSAIPDIETDILAPSTVLFSSGTTANPKGVVLSQYNICTNVVSGMQRFESIEGARYYSILPYSHAFGLTCDMLTPVYSGGTICVPRSKMTYLSEFSAYAPSALYAPPAIAKWIDNMLSSGADKKDVTGENLKQILCGGAPLDAETAERLESAGILALGCYGMSECSPGIALNGNKMYRHGTSGLVMSCNTVSIDDSEIIVKGSNVMIGYLNDAYSTSRVLRDGWLHTGDTGFFDGDGFLNVTGRLDNMICFMDGTKCIPETIESVINTINGVNESLVCKAGEHLKVIVSVSGEKISRGTVMSFLNQSGCELADRVCDVELTCRSLQRSALGKLIRGAVESNE